MHRLQPERLHRQCYHGTWCSNDGSESWTDIKFVGERNARRLDGLETALADGDVIAIIPTVAGG